MTSWWSMPVLAGALGASLLAGGAPLPASGPPEAGQYPVAWSAPHRGTASAPTEAAERDARRAAPVPGEPSRPFVAPAHRYGPGHRGVDLVAPPDSPVEATAAGTVRFAGPVAGRRVVVLQHGDGRLTSLEPVRAIVPVGTRVAAGEEIGLVEAVNGGYVHCPVSCVHWGLRADGEYVDPWAWLSGKRPVRLLPVQP